MVLATLDIEAAISDSLILAVEVLSPSTRRKDLFLKRSKYEDAGVESYWIVDPEGPSILALELVDGHYVTVGESTGDEAVTSRSPFPSRLSPRNWSADGQSLVIGTPPISIRRTLPVVPKSMVAVARCPTPSTATTVPSPYLSCETRFPTASSSTGPDPSGRRFPARDGALSPNRRAVTGAERPPGPDGFDPNVRDPPERPPKTLPP